MRAEQQPPHPKSWRFIQSKELYPYNTAISNRHFGSLPNTVRRVVNLWGEIGASGRIVGKAEVISIGGSLRSSAWVGCNSPRVWSNRIPMQSLAILALRVIPVIPFSWEIQGARETIETVA